MIKEERSQLYEFITGKIDFVGPEYIVVDNSGVGYQIGMPNPFIYSRKLGEVVKVYTYQHVRQDILALYGFQTRNEKTLFLNLISVSGIGPKGALAILASGEPEAVVQAIEREDEVFLTKFPGVGKKTARQIILDLKGKLPKVLPEYFPDLLSENQQTEERDTDSFAHQLEEAMLALRALGYSERELKKVTPVLQQEKLTTDQYIKLALKKLLNNG